jgi:hypothetical protein
MKAINMRLAILLALIVSNAFSLDAQDLASIIFGDIKGNYIGQYNYNGKRKNGFGVERYKNGAIYMGDFSDDNITGRGMMISLDKEISISGISGTAVYIGSWLKGKKNGRGICYDKTGKVIFEGRFADDKPSEKAATPSGKLFCISEIGDDVYFGEVANNTQDGLGFTVQSDGCMVYGLIKDGVRQSIGMIIHDTDDWEVGRWTDGNFVPLTNSNISSQNIATHKADTKEYRKETRKELKAAASCFGQAALSIASMATGNVNGASGDVASGGSTEGGKIESGKSKSYYQSQYNKWESRAKNTYEDRVRHKVSASTYSDGRVAASDAKVLRNYQKLMRDVRQAASKEGFSIAPSKYESVSF